MGGCGARDSLGMDPSSTTPGGIALYGWGDVVRFCGQGSSQYGDGWDFPCGPTFTANSRKLSHPWRRIEWNSGEFPENRKFLDFWRYDTNYLPIIAAFRESITRSTITARREKWWPFAAGKYRLNREQSELYLDRRHIDPFSGLKKWTNGGALNFIWCPVRVYGGFVSNKGKVEKTKPPHTTKIRAQREGPKPTPSANQHYGQTKPPPSGRTKRNTEREPAKRENETTTNAEQRQPKAAKKA